MEDEHRGTYCTWCGKPGGYMWTTMRETRKVYSFFVTVGGTVHDECREPWLAWVCEKQDLYTKED